MQEPESEANKAVLLSIIKATSACRVVVHETTSALFWLNQGATKVLLSPVDSLAEASLPKDRVVLILGDSKNAEERIGALKELATEFLVSFSGDLGTHTEIIKKVCKRKEEISLP